MDFELLPIQSITFKLLDIFIVWWIVYQVLKIIKNNVRATQLIKGVFWVYLINVLSHWLNLSLLTSLSNEIMTWGILAVIIIFQPEIRGGLEHLGRNSALKKKNTMEIHWIEEVLTAIDHLSQEQTGALIVIERQITLDEFIKTGTLLESIISSSLLRTLFNSNTPLHDGAIVIRHGRIHAAGVILPSTRLEELESELGTRHRAALGVSELSDSITLVVSEESGKCSLAHRGQLTRFDNAFDLEQSLRALLDMPLN